MLIQPYYYFSPVLETLKAVLPWAWTTPFSFSLLQDVWHFFRRENQHFVTGLLNTFLKFNNTRSLYICTGWVKKVALREEEDFAMIAST